MNNLPGRCVLSIDVEDWFHILELPSAPRISQWGQLPSHVERNFRHLLELAREYEARCTCFFVGWVARRYPHLVRAAVREGHEVASHGWAHRLASCMTPDEFYRDARRTREVLEGIAGCRVIGYRAAGFSLTANSEWLFDQLLRAGYLYDASLFPAHHGHGGWSRTERAPFEIQRAGGKLAEFPMTIENLLGHPMCFFGGGYLRLCPLPLIEKMARRVLRQGRPVIFYVHPREIDPDHPRLPMSPWRAFKSYVNLNTTEDKLRHLMKSFEFSALVEFLTPRSEATSTDGLWRTPQASLREKAAPCDFDRLPACNERVS